MKPRRRKSDRKKEGKKEKCIFLTPSSLEPPHVATLSFCLCSQSGLDPTDEDARLGGDVLALVSASHPPCRDEDGLMSGECVAED